MMLMKIRVWREWLHGTIYGMGWREGWESGACDTLARLVKDGIITKEQDKTLSDEWHL